jgi:flavin-dependent dehydrogenase
MASNCPPARQLLFDVGPFALIGAPPPANGVTEGYAPRRTVLDTILVDAALAAGAELREHFSVEELTSDGEGITGIRGHVVGGARVTEQARIVIGADGRRSFVARSVQAPVYNAKPTRTCAYYSYWSGVPIEGPELYPRQDRMLIAGPTNDDQTLVQVFWPNALFQEVRANIEDAFFTALDLAPSLAERVRSGKRSERFRGMADLPFFFRKPYGPGWALVGDAGYHKDPITAEGITDAFRDAELLADTLDDGFSGRRPLDEALGAYEQARNETAMPIYDFTYDLAGLEPPSLDMQPLFGALHQNQEQTNRFFGVIAGTVGVSEFFAPDNIGQIIAAAV